jgi:hypothetical protein
MTTTTQSSTTLAPGGRRALLELHRELVALQRREVERVQGRLNGGEALQAATRDVRFRWIDALSAGIGELDAAADAEEAARAADRLRELLAAPDAETAFGLRYLRALQEEPGVVLAHRDAVAALSA